MGNPRKDDESVQTSLRALMEEEEARVRAESERLEQLRAAKIRLDRERADAAREEEERRLVEREAMKAAAVERARIEALAKAEADRRAEERAIENRATENRAIETAPPLPPTRSRFGTGVAAGVMSAALVGSLLWFLVEAPRFVRESRRASSAWSEAEAARTRAHDAESALADERDQRRIETDALRAENGRLRRALADVPKCTPTTTTTAPHRTTHTRCDPHDPLCADL